MNNANNTPALSITAPNGSKAKTKLTSALQDIKDALSGKKIFYF